MKRMYMYALLIVACTLSFFIMLTVQVQRGTPLWLDAAIKDRLQVQGDEYNSFFKLVTEMGAEPGLITVLLLALIWLWRRKRYPSMLVLPLAMIAGQLLNKGVKELVARDRPQLLHAVQETGYSFPSGHAMLAIVTYGFLIYLIFHEKLGKPIRVMMTAGAILLILLVGVSRIVLSAHYPTDILAGYCLGGFLLAAACYVDHAYTRRR